MDIDPARSALLSMDFQAGIVSIYVSQAKPPDATSKEAEQARAHQDVKGEWPAIVQRAASVLAKARRAGMRVIHVRVGFRPNLPEVSPRNTLFSAIKTSSQHQKLFQGAAGEIHPGVAPAADEVVITKHRVSAFTGTDLAMILRANDIDTLVLFGIATSGVVLATMSEAVDADYRLFVVADCCADLDPEVHACLIEKVFPRRAGIISADEFLAAPNPNR